MKTTSRKILWIFLALVMVQASCLCALPSLFGTSTPATESPIMSDTSVPTAAITTQPAVPPSGIYPDAFAAYDLPDVSLPQRFASASYSLPVDLNQVEGMDMFELSDEARRMLRQMAGRQDGGRAGRRRPF